MVFSGTPHAELLGQFRSHPIDNDLTQGRPLRDRDGPISKQQLRNLQSNPYIKVQKFEFDPIKENVSAYLEFPVAAEVTQLVEKEIRELQTLLHSTKSQYEKFSGSVKSYHRLISIHPYHNGNGRVLRLFYDGVFLRLGLPPAVHNFDKEFTANLSELESYILLGMNDYLIAKEQVSQ